MQRSTEKRATAKRLTKHWLERNWLTRCAPGKTRHLPAVVVWGAGLLLALGCEESTPDRCVPGESVVCEGVNGCAGIKVCDTNGLVFGSCQCNPPVAKPPTERPGTSATSCTPGDTRSCLGPNECPGTASCSTSGTFGACRCDAPTQVPSLRPNLLGAACRSNLDCGSSLICWQESGLGPAGSAGGPGGGYCTSLCRDSANCQLFEQPGDCFHFSDAELGVCFASCSSASSAGCQSRSDIACAAYSALSLTAPASASGDGLCVPRCASDADCPGGGQCNLAQPIATCLGERDAGSADSGP